MTYAQQLAQAFPQGAIIQMGADTADADGDRSAHHVAALHLLDDNHVVMWDSAVGNNRIIAPTSFEVVTEKPLLVRINTDMGELEVRGEDEPAQITFNDRLRPAQEAMVRSMAAAAR